MNRMTRILMTMMIALGLNGCATTGVEQTRAEVQRISPEELAKLMAPAVATVSLDELLADAKQGKTPDEIIAKIKASNSRYELTPTQSLELNKKGLDIKVLEFIHQENERAKQNALADEMNKRQQAQAEKEKALKQERDLARTQYYDPYWGMYYGRPWGPYGPNPYTLRYRYLGPKFGWGLGYGW
ncbi:MAG: hypothetical protein SFU55_04285 [Methylophilus sp.]|nr:hypothetical protein [Methylophilus sp.]